MSKITVTTYDIRDLIDFDHVTNGQVARRLGLDRNSVVRYKSQGMSATVADRVATKLDRHPAEVWPHFYDEHEEQPCT